MADFRRWFTALAVLALMAGLANAQIGIAGSTTAGAFVCTASAAATPQLRPEGYTELLGDLVINCTGGQTLPIGQLIPTTNITLVVTPALPITSRLMGSGGPGGGGISGPSEALLIIDETGNTALPTGVVGNFGPKAPQLLCADTTTSGGCAAFVNSDNGYEVAVTAVGGTTNAANVYQGNLNTNGVNTVTFYGVPILPPVTSGVTRTYRITNVRVPIPGSGLGNNSQISVFISTNGSTALPLSQASFPVGIVADPGLRSSISSPPPNLQQCLPGTFRSVDLIFTEGFATAFKTRAVPLTNTQFAAEALNNGATPVATAQNLPGGLYGGFAQNSESGFIFRDLTAVTGSSTYTAGLADFGTRLKAVFTNIPAGITVFVTGANTNVTTGGVIDPSALGSQNTTSAAVLWTPSNSSGGGSEGQRYTSGFTPRATNYATLVSVPQSGGSAVAVWEVTNANPASIDTLTFTVWIGFTFNPSAITTSTPYGLPNITGVAGQPTSNVSLSFAPENTANSSSGAFSTSVDANGRNVATYPGTNPIPRFTNLHPFSGEFARIVLCQTTLLYPFVTANPAGGLGQGFDTGIAIANTSKDPFLGLGIPTNVGTGLVAVGGGQAATPTETGSCTLYPFGVTISATGVQGPPPSTISGCDIISNPVPGTNCFPIVQPGTVQTVLASQVFPTFQGYVIAVCNFQYAHGYAAVTDLGLRGLFASYLALEMNAGILALNPRGTSIEQLVH